MLPTTPQRCTHDYVRHGTTSLFAAYDLASGSVIAQHYRRHRHQEFLGFLKQIDAAFHRGSTCILSLIITVRTNTRRLVHGWRAIRAFTFTSRQPMRLGSIRSSGGSGS